MSTANAKTIYSALQRYGITRAQARKLMPDWWTPEIEGRPGGVAELGLHLSRRLSLDLTSLLNGRATAKGAVAQVAFKRDARLENEKINGATLVASSVAQSVIAAMPERFRGFGNSPAAVQAQAKALNRDLPLGFESLLGLCWNRGVPVIPLPNLPVGMRKMDGAALQVKGRQAIVIAKRKSSRAWLSFILAHEMAHLILGHVRDGASIIDVSLEQEATLSSGDPEDRQEADADVFALDLLGGSRVADAISSWSPRMSAVELAVQGRAVAKELGVEPGHVILRHAFVTRRWPEAANALKFLSEDLDPNGLLVSWLEKKLDLERVAEDLQDLVTQVTGLDDQ